MILVITNVFGINISITNVNSFGTRLRQARTLRQLTQKELAAACGLSQGAIGNYESNSRLNAKDIFRIAEVLNVEPAWLAMGTGPMDVFPRLKVADPATAGNSAWPLPGVDPERIWALPKGKRHKLAEALMVMLTALEDEP